ncbi:MAG: glycoside hydrolase family 43 protein [Rhodothermales bacterium]
MKKLRHILPLVLAMTAAACGGPAGPDPGTAFVNPLLPAGADPWVIHRDGFYYYMHTTGRNLTLRKTRKMSELAQADPVVVWSPPETGPYSHGIWAPELHHLDGAWYIYFAADAGQNASHRLWVLENRSPDPTTGEWTMKGKLADPADRWAIDGTVFEHAGRRYLAWSGWEGETNGVQHLYLAPMADPWTLAGPRVRISTPTLPWETVGDIPNPGDGPAHVDVNEGPQFLRRGDRVFIVYSASGCWTDAYTLGLLSADAGSDLLDPASWTKHPEPVFASAPGAHAAGHNSFFTSPDGSEDWILYHANPEPGQGCGGRRSPRMQRFDWDADGLPRLGAALTPGDTLAGPSGE